VDRVTVTLGLGLETFLCNESHAPRLVAVQQQLCRLLLDLAMLHRQWEWSSRRSSESHFGVVTRLVNSCTNSVRWGCPKLQVEHPRRGVVRVLQPDHVEVAGLAKVECEG
jgi:hypothetical protein